MMKILKASAGSGKTYNLARTYIDLLLRSEDRYAYRHILAVTFTNKATEEMKSRILKELYILAKDSGRSDYLSYFSDIPDLEAKASSILTDILHDYGAFSISTIDRFFQQTLKSFSREIGQFSQYQIELDKKSLVNETVERMLDSLDTSMEKSPLVSWLNDSVMAQLNTLGIVDLDKGLGDMAALLMTPELKDICQSMGLNEKDLFSKKKLSAISKECSQARKSFVEKLHESAGRVICDMQAGGFEYSDFHTSFLKILDSYVDVDAESIKKPTDPFLSRAADSSRWTTASKRSLIPAMESAIGKSLSAFLSLWELDYKVFQTAGIILKMVYELGMAADIYQEFDALVREKNVLSLDDSNTILKNIIDGSDAPFIYEKLGVRFDHFLLDEFQDTSTVQWENFRPLLRESESKGKDCLIVGDVKQSIYRWRNSDWRLLGSGVKSEFPDSHEDSLKQNWRSCRQIVEFNNAFFDYASKAIPEAEEIYADVRQQPCSSDPQSGQVVVSFCEKDAELEKVNESVRKARERGAGWSDIAVLVRSNKEASMVAASLMGEEVPVMSNEALVLKNSLLVRRIVSLLSYVADPQDQVGAYLADNVGVEIPEQWNSLPDLCESLIRSLALNEGSPGLAEDAVYIQAFMDVVSDFSSAKGNNLDAFLKHFAEKEFKINSPSDADAVRIMTIHSSKGLEFKYVIFPFAEKVTLYKDVQKWCAPEHNGTIPEATSLLYPVELGSRSAKDLFEESYLQEKKMQAVDNLNIFYVALTRAEKTLHIIADAKPKKEGDRASNLAQVLLSYVGGGDYCVGDDYDFTRMKRKQKEDGIPYPVEYRSYELGDRLSFGRDASEFFGKSEDAMTLSMSERMKGTLLHDILSHVIEKDDLPSAVKAAVDGGRISAMQGEEYLSLLQERIASAQSRGWFAPLSEGLRPSGNEITVIDTDGSESRPDRVEFHKDCTLIIDYKFGEESERYKRQLQRYKQLFQRMDYPDVRAFIWYVMSDKVVSV